MALNNTGKTKGVYKILYPAEDVRLEFINKTHRGQLIFRENDWVFDPPINISNIEGAENLEDLTNLVKYTDFNSQFNVDETTKQVSLNVEYITLTNYSPSEDIQPDPSVDPDFLISSNFVNILQEESTTVQIVLTTEPLANVVFNITSSDSLAASNTPSILFTKFNWNIPQDITITGLTDDNEVDIEVTLTVSIDTTTDLRYLYLPSKTIDVLVNVPQQADFIVSKSVINLTAGQNTDFIVSISQQPTSNVFIATESSNESAVTISDNYVLFTPSNWSPKQVLVDAVSNSETVTTSIQVYVLATNDTNYTDLPGKQIAANITSALQPGEIKIGNTIWKTKNSSWTDGGTGIFAPNNNEVSVEAHGRLYTRDAVLRLLAAHPGYRVVSLLDYELLRNTYPRTDNNGVVRINGEKVYLDGSGMWSFRTSSGVIDNASGLGFTSSGLSYEISSVRYYANFNRRGIYWMRTDANFNNITSIIFYWENDFLSSFPIGAPTAGNNTQVPAYSVRLVKDI